MFFSICLTSGFNVSIGVCVAEVFPSPICLVSNWTSSCLARYIESRYCKRTWSSAIRCRSTSSLLRSARKQNEIYCLHLFSLEYKIYPPLEIDCFQYIMHGYKNKKKTKDINLFFLSTALVFVTTRRQYGWST